MKRILLLTLSAVLLITGFVFGEEVTIAQIDSSALLINQRVNLYVSVLDDNNLPLSTLDTDQFRIFESGDGITYQEVPILSVKTEANIKEGITFFLLIDNSGSMYDPIPGAVGTSRDVTKIAQAKQAIRTFLDSMAVDKDRVGLSSFNTRFNIHTDPVTDTSLINRFLEQIEEPDTEDAYTQLYSSLLLSAERMSGIPGRKVLIVLSDGENFPYYTHTGKPHPEFGTETIDYKQAVERFQEEGITVFSINYGTGGDSNLPEVSRQTGGDVYDAGNRSELANVYLNIKNRVLKEYLFTYKATMVPAEKKHVRIELRRGGETFPAERFYFSSTLAGQPFSAPLYLLIIPLLLGLLGWWGLSRLRFINKAKHANLEVISWETGSLSTRYLNLTGNATVIGGSPNADMTISGQPDVADTHATILFDPTTKKYSVDSEEDVMVNNRSVKKKNLEPGDVIRIGDATIVFDEESEKDQREKK
jgi:Ca-activated chloride channel family protein